MWPRGHLGAAASCGQVIAGGIAARPRNPSACQPRAVGRRREAGQGWATCACLPTVPAAPAAPPAGPAARGGSSMVPGGPAWGQRAFHAHPSRPCSLARGGEAGWTPASGQQQPRPRGAPWAAGVGTRTHSWLLSPCYSRRPLQFQLNPWVCWGEGLGGPHAQVRWQSSLSTASVPGQPRPLLEQLQLLPHQPASLCPRERPGSGAWAQEGPWTLALGMPRGRGGGTGGRAFRGSPTRAQRPSSLTHPTLPTPLTAHPQAALLPPALATAAATLPVSTSPRSPVPAWPCPGPWAVAPGRSQLGQELLSPGPP